MESSASCPAERNYRFPDYEVLIFGSEQHFLRFVVARVIYARNLDYLVFDWRAVETSFALPWESLKI